jgi:hypothetical protein
MHLDQSCPCEVRSSEVSSTEIGSVKRPVPAQLRAFVREKGSGEVSSPEVSVNQASPPEVCCSEVGVAEVCPGEIRAPEVCCFEVASFEVATCQPTDFDELQSAQLESLKVLIAGQPAYLELRYCDFCHCLFPGCESSSLASRLPLSFMVL